MSDHLHFHTVDLTPIYNRTEKAMLFWMVICYTRNYHFEKDSCFFVGFCSNGVTDVQCPPPENPLFGTALFTSTSYNSVVSYSCKHAYMLVGEGTRKCGADRKWSGTAPKCQGKYLETERYFLQSYSTFFFFLSLAVLVSFLQLLAAKKKKITTIFNALYV